MAYANPDAVTSIGGTSYAYDNAGNETTAGSSSFAWDWRNLLNTSAVGATSTTYNYDENGKRMRVSDGTTIFYYPNDLYQTDSVSGVPTKHVQLNGRDIAVITGATGSSTANYSFPDNQNSTNVVTDSTSNIQQTQDYFPYGGSRINTGSNVQQRKYIGQFSDASGLDYLNARYLSSDRGQFTSEDPIFLGDPKSQNIKNPQSLNSYSYSADNPITKSDPAGKCIEDGCVGETLLAIAVFEEAEAEAPEIENAVSSAVSTAPEVESAASNFENFYNLPDRSTFQQYQEVSGWPSETADETAIQSWRADSKALYYGSILFTAGVASCDLGCDWAEAEIKTLEAQNDKSSHGSPSIGASNRNQFSGANRGFQSIQNSFTVQSRAAAVSGYNASSGASNPQSQLWVTPSGAVVTWGGSVVASPVSSKK